MIQNEKKFFGRIKTMCDVNFKVVEKDQILGM
jgi:hypothetical protein